MKDERGPGLTEPPCISVPPGISCVIFCRGRYTPQCGNIILTPSFGVYFSQTRRCDCKNSGEPSFPRPKQTLGNAQHRKTPTGTVIACTEHQHPRPWMTCFALVGAVTLAGCASWHQIAPWDLCRWICSDCRPGAIPRLCRFETARCHVGIEHFFARRRSGRDVKPPHLRCTER